MAGDLFRVLSLDGGGAKGFYTLGVLREIEQLIGCPIHERFDLIFGTSTGSVIAALLALGEPVEKIHQLYAAYVPRIMRKLTPWERSWALEKLAKEVFGDRKFDAVKMDIGIVATRWHEERPMIFKNNVNQAHGQRESFVEGFGCTIAEAVVASCSAYPFFCRKYVTTSQGDKVLLMDGGFCANNPTLYALADATTSMKKPIESIRIVSIGVGEYPEPTRYAYHLRWWINLSPIVRLLQKTLEVNTQSMDQLRDLLFRQVKTVRISDAFTRPELATDLLEYRIEKLNLLRQQGVHSYGRKQDQLREYLT